MHNINTLVFSKDKYNNDRNELFQAVAEQLAILMKNDYVCKVYDDDVDVIVIEYEHDERRGAWGCAELLWATQTEIDFLNCIEYNTGDDGDDEM